MKISKEELLKETVATGFRPEILEKVWHLMTILNAINEHFFLSGKLVLKGGTALNLFIFDLPRLSVDIDLNYVGHIDKEAMLLERPLVEKALEAVFRREGMSIQRIPQKHAGGKWQLKYYSSLTVFSDGGVMTRKQRYHIPGAFYHIMMRGNDGQTIFFYNEERCRLCLLIQEGVGNMGIRMHAFCLMGNNIHLLIRVGLTPLSKIIHNLSFRYSQYFNRRHKKIGHVFQGRFKAILIQEEAYFLRSLRYITYESCSSSSCRRTRGLSLEWPWSIFRPNGICVAYN